ncbi:MAG: M3 family oligoendopeptidase [Campylobacter sp.]|nr:M3 family oligoendopeptidase [Campylobacter sp.]
MYTWDLSALFKDEKELEKFSEEVDKECKNFQKKYENNFENLSENDVIKALEIYENLNEKLVKIMTYAYLKFAADTNTGGFYAKYNEKCTKIEQNLVFFELKFNELPKQKQDKIIAKTPKFAYYLSNLQKQKAHQLSIKEEKILLRTSNTGAQAFARLFDESLSAIKFDFKGEKLNEEEILSKLHSHDRQERKIAAQSLSDGLAKHQKLLTFIYNMIKTDLNTKCELRNFKLAEESRHLDNQIDKKSVDALIKAAENSFDLPIKYYEKKRKILAYDKLYDYDRYAPLATSDKKYDYETCKKIVLKTFSDFSPKFGEIAKNAFENGWIDVYPNASKRGGAFSHSATSDAHPYVLLNHTDEIGDLFTLAHELGHSVHQSLSYSVGYLNSDTPLTTAETASVFCEMLTFDSIKSSLSKQELASLLAKKLEDIFATLYRQINFTTFERAIHAYEGEISSEKINEIWLRESQKMFGKSVILNDYYKIWWSYVPHFIHTPFYCYAYAYAQLLVLALFGLYKSGKFENFVEIYTKFLSSGGSKSPKELISMFGFDIDDEKFWQIGLNEIKKMLDEFEELL